jgi:hypothetical protein
MKPLKLKASLHRKQCKRKYEYAVIDIDLPKDQNWSMVTDWDPNGGAYRARAFLSDDGSRISVEIRRPMKGDDGGA